MTTKFFDRLSNDLTQLLKDTTDYNVTIEIGEAPNNQIFKVHSYILQSRKKLENSTIFDLVIASNELELDELVKHLQTYLVNNRASWLRLKFAQIHRTSYQVKNFETLQEFCNDIIAKHPSTIFESENFCSLSEDALMSIIKRDDLQLVEGQIWEYMIQWGKAKNPFLPTNIEKWTIENFSTLKTTLKGCLPHIRYFSFSHEDVLEKLFPYQQILEPKLWLDINTKIMAPNKPISSRVLPTRTIFNSNILTIEHFLEILSWIDRQEPYYTGNIQCKFELLVRGSRDGFDVKKIYNICDKVSNMIIVLKVKGTGEILGGYNPLPWNKEKNEKMHTKDSFAFSLKTSNLKNSILSRVKNYDYGIASHTLVLRDNLRTSKLSYCRINGDCFDKPIRSAEFLGLVHCPPSSDKCTFNVEEYETANNIQNSVLSRIKNEKFAFKYPLPIEQFGPWFGNCEFPT
ncbi:hypothetical protein Glove_313g32 [Diversispora epigaea]|uniref:TLDc domain-containing protein n=1 Tax=Diversispora epigaea TaxID=1348612 RepID=A0A397HWR0_9GLOM|nr:hypothetical protein Glove_313g32 [Diversispora epigaea]